MLSEYKDCVKDWNSTKKTKITNPTQDKSYKIRLKSVNFFLNLTGPECKKQ